MQPTTGQTLTEEQIREIILKRRRAQARKRRKKKQIRALCVLALILVLLVTFTVKVVHRLTASPEEQLVRGVIFIDPGHGGNDPGAEVKGKYEKDDTLALSLELRKALADKGFKVYMSRSDDSSVPRPDRGEMANSHNAELMVSIHRNQSENGGDGVEVWINSSDPPESRLLGENIMAALVEAGFKERSVRAGTLPDPADDYQENLTSNMPSCIVEVGFMTDSGDNQRFNDNMASNAGLMADAIEKTYASLYEDPQTEDADASKE